MGAFGICAVNGAGQAHWVPHIAVVPGDVVVAHQHQLGVGLQAGQHVLVQGLEPAHFVHKLIAVWGLTIRKVSTNHPHAQDRGADDPRHVVFKTGDVVHHILQGVAADQGHAVVRFLAKVGNLVTAGFYVGTWKFVVGQLGLLQGQHIHGRVGCLGL